MKNNSQISEDYVDGILDSIIEVRRDIHAHPETGFEEYRTSNLVKEKLEALGYVVHSGIAKTGLVAVLQGEAGDGLMIGLRADLDALYIHEANEKTYASTCSGKMHACGHDGHTAMLLGAATYFAKHRNFKGKICFIFQPAEEGLGGAKQMIEEGVLEKFPCDQIYAMHNMPGVPAGFFAIANGLMTAASDTWEVKFFGTGGHGSSPQKNTDVTVVGGQFISALQSIVSRSVDPLEGAVISIGYIQAGNENTPNVIPAEFKMRGTARSYNRKISEIFEQRMKTLAENIADAYKCRAEVKYQRLFPALFNDHHCFENAVQAASQVVGKENVKIIPRPGTGSEDFAFFLEKIPGAYIVIGNGVDAEHAHDIHTPHYDFNDAIIKEGILYFINLIYTINR
ncbi:M20 aminoacylase family protein [Acinetobacter oleivorans]|uniref:M20 aminoacylase family protein n=1 Tax=Acinetobacter oleivorans TaxID=1148157 RepID=UPI001CD3F96A|nr:M20 aminoacylase family protein [Acinetobacter oleivorans]